MKIQKKKNIDGEVDRFLFRFRQHVPNGVETVRGLFQDWIRAREANGTCACWLKHLSVQEGRNAREIEVLFGWFCDRCLPWLESAVKERLPSVTGLSVGNDLSPYPGPTSGSFTSPRRSLTLRMARQCRWPRSRICRSRVTTGQYDEFTRATGYVTGCERSGEGSFRFDETIEPIRPRDRGNLPVHSVSFEDAQAYCDWAEFRLPREAELLGAALIDQRVVTPAERKEFLFGKSGRFDIERFPGALADLGREFVSGTSEAGKAVVRYGPYYIREVGWDKRPSRVECSTDEYDLMIGFRVCRRTSVP